MTLDCEACDTRQEMEGGTLVEEKQKAGFVCPKCNYVNKIDWKIDI